MCDVQLKMTIAFTAVYDEKRLPNLELMMQTLFNNVCWTEIRQFNGQNQSHDPAYDPSKGPMRTYVLIFRCNEYVLRGGIELERPKTPFYLSLNRAPANGDPTDFVVRYADQLFEYGVVSTDEDGRRITRWRPMSEFQPDILLAFLRP